MDWWPSPEGIRDNLYASAIWLLLGILGAAVLAGWVWLREMVSPPILVALTIGFYGLILLAINQTRALFRKGLEQKLGQKLDGMEQRVGKLEGSRAPFVEPKFNEIIYPSPVGVLWALDIEKNVVGGPLCPRHRDRLFYKHAVGGTEGKDVSNRWLSGGWLFCPTDWEEFKIMERTVQVKKLQDEADTVLRSRMGRGN